MLSVGFAFGVRIWEFWFRIRLLWVFPWFLVMVIGAVGDGSSVWVGFWFRWVVSF